MRVAGTYSAASGATSSSTCTSCPANFHSPAGSDSIANCTCNAGFTGEDGIFTVAPSHPPYLAATAESWDSTLNRFTDVSGNGRHGTLAGGTAQQGTGAGHGAAVNVPFVGGTTATQIQWPVGSIPSTFTVCSVTRYTSTSNAAAQERILQSTAGNWLHGHWGAGGWGTPGATSYGGASGNYGTPPVNNFANLGMASRTDWVVTCGRNTVVAGQVGTMANGVTTSTATGGTGNQQLAINLQSGGSEFSDWQLSRVYVWDSHLPDDVFYAVSNYLRGSLAGNEPGFRRCVGCVAGTYKEATGDAACSSCPAKSSSPANSTAKTNCTCNAGYTGKCF